MSLLDTEVQVAEGILSGSILITSNYFEYFSFKSIPYAAPPIDSLRFADPLPPEPWEGVRDCTRDCYICTQFDKETAHIIGNEDCLYLNIYAPKNVVSKGSLFPVMVFLHGGGFIFGSGTDDSVHGPDYLVEKNVVVVSLNYRLGILGFLALDCKEAAGNMGLKDQVQALRWLKENIKVFNGDPENITVFGFSAGAASVEYLLLSPMANGLFHKAIAHSGSSLLPWAQNNSIKDLAKKIPLLKGKLITEDKDLLNYLKNMPSEDLVLGSLAVLAAEKKKSGMNFGYVPTIEKSGDWEPFINKSTYKALASGEFNKVPYIAGCCTREGLLMVSHVMQTLERFIHEKNFMPYLPFEFDGTEDFETRFKAVYMDGPKVYNEEDEYAINFFTDLNFNGGIYLSTSFIAQCNSPVYFYEFSYDGNLNYLKNKHHISRKGACHGDDGGYLIKTKVTGGDLSATDILVKDRMCLMWSNFAKYGDPTPTVDGNIITTKWEPFTKENQACFVIDAENTVKYEFYPERMKLFKELYEKYYKQ